MYLTLPFLFSQQLWVKDPIVLHLWLHLMFFRDDRRRTVILGQKLRHEERKSFREVINEIKISSSSLSSSCCSCCFLVLVLFLLLVYTLCIREISVSLWGREGAIRNNTLKGVSELWSVCHIWTPLNMQLLVKPRAYLCLCYLLKAD